MSRDIMIPTKYLYGSDRNLFGNNNAKTSIVVVTTIFVVLLVHCFYLLSIQIAFYLKIPITLL